MAARMAVLVISLNRTRWTRSSPPGEPSSLARCQRDGLALPVGVGREKHAARLASGLLDVGEDLRLVADDHVLRLESLVDVDAELRLRQVHDVADRGQHLVGATQVLLDGLRLGGRLDHDEARALARLPGLRRGDDLVAGRGRLGLRSLALLASGPGGGGLRRSLRLGIRRAGLLLGRHLSLPHRVTRRAGRPGQRGPDAGRGGPPASTERSGRSSGPGAPSSPRRVVRAPAMRRGHIRMGSDKVKPQPLLRPDPGEGPARLRPVPPRPEWRGEGPCPRRDRQRGGAAQPPCRAGAAPGSGRISTWSPTRMSKMLRRTKAEEARSCESNTTTSPMTSRGSPGVLIGV